MHAHASSSATWACLVICVEDFLHDLPETFLPLEDLTWKHVETNIYIYIWDHLDSQQRHILWPMHHFPRPWAGDCLLGNHIGNHLGTWHHHPRKFQGTKNHLKHLETSWNTILALASRQRWKKMCAKSSQSDVTAFCVLLSASICDRIYIYVYTCIHIFWQLLCQWSYKSAIWKKRCILSEAVGGQGGESNSDKIIRSRDPHLEGWEKDLL